MTVQAQYSSSSSSNALLMEGNKQFALDYRALRWPPPGVWARWVY